MTLGSAGPISDYADETSITVESTFDGHHPPSYSLTSFGFGRTYSGSDGEPSSAYFYNFTGSSAVINSSEVMWTPSFQGLGLHS